MEIAVIIDREFLWADGVEDEAQIARFGWLKERLASMGLHHRGTTIARRYLELATATGWSCGCEPPCDGECLIERVRAVDGVRSARVKGDAFEEEELTGLARTIVMFAKRWGGEEISGSRGQSQDVTPRQRL